jgi:flagellar biosynthetic protein FlhB
MADGPDQDEKTEEPTAKKLDDARKRGEIVYSPEVGAWLVLAAGGGALLLMGGPMANQLGHLLVGFLQQPEAIPTDGETLTRLTGTLLLHVGAAVGLVGLGICGAGLASRFIQDRPAFSFERMQPKMDKIDPMKGFQRTFGPQGFSNFFKGLLKFLVVGAAATWALWPNDDTLATAPLRDLTAFWPLLMQKASTMVLACLFAFGVIAIGDYVLTRQAYMKRMRMTRQELRDEMRQSEGDPQVRMKLRQVRNERARRRMMTQVPTATLVVTNPTHYAVAMRYVAGETDAPICVAKGVDEVAFKIRETAEAHSVPVVEDPPLARALYATAELDAPIPREHYEAVAKTISYVLRLAARRRGRVAAGPNR